jgi:cation-transporting ATPase E
VIQARPFNWWKTLLVGSMIGAVALILAIPPLADFYAVKLPSGDMLAEASLVAGIAIALLEVGWRLSRVVANRRAVA